jgi:deoxyribodipyrimidine photo-lyase
MREKISIFWFRRDLRFEDNTALHYALQSGFDVIPIFIFDKGIIDLLEDRADARLSFIHDRISHLKAALQLAGSDLVIRYGTPETVFSELLSAYEVDGIYANRDYEPYAISRDLKINTIAEAKGTQFYDFKDQVIFEKGEILTDAGDPYKVFTPFKNKWLSKFNALKLTQFPVDVAQGFLPSSHPEPMISLRELGFEKTKIIIPASDVAENVITKYDQQRNFPAIPGTTKLGIHLRHGTLSVRQLVVVGDKLSPTWLNELIWREFYMSVLAHFPHVVDRAFKPKYDHIPWRNDEEGYEKWCEGMTGYPIVDAGMRELNATGFMHNRVRMVTASFLTKHLLIDWRWGEAYFAKKLLDFELASNNGGWQWAAGTGTDAQPYFRVFNPTSQMEKFDKDLVYIRKWVPELDTSSYPKPIVDHKFARQRAIDTYKEALK